MADSSATSSHHPFAAQFAYGYYEGLPDSVYNITKKNLPGMPPRDFYDMELQRAFIRSTTDLVESQTFTSFILRGPRMSAGPRRIWTLSGLCADLLDGPSLHGRSSSCDGDVLSGLTAFSQDC